MHYLVLLSIIALVHGQDYCAKNLCSYGKHVACNNAGKWDSTCPKDATLLNMAPYMNIILDSHNDKRNCIANGSLNSFEPAQRMAVMQWDEELAKLAAFNVKQCTMRHDQCRATSKFPYAGQNLGMFAYSGPANGYSNEFLVENLVDAWWKENKDALPAHLASYPLNYRGAVIGHFTVMAADENVAVGCAAARYTKTGFNYFLLACNYATTNIVQYPIYTAGPAASACKTGTDATYSSLCSSSESY